MPQDLFVAAQEDEVLCMSRTPGFFRTVATAFPPIRRLLTQREYLLGALAEEKKRGKQLEETILELESQLQDVEFVKDSKQLYPLGHFYSPVPSKQDIARFDTEYERLAASPTLPAINLNSEGQLETIQRLSRLYAPELLPGEQTTGHRYYSENEMFAHPDAVLLQTMLRLLSPKRVVEVGSGFSSALILDTRDAFLGPNLHCTFIEPNPDRLDLLLSDADRETVDIMVSPVQEIPTAVFESLEANDILFIDSSHVSKVASDVNWLVFSILPSLKPGVYVHIHDIFYPFDYLQIWIHEGRGWTEAYLLRAFLEFNSEFEIFLFSSYLRKFHRNEVATAMPLWDRGEGGSLWLKRRQ